MILSLDNNNKVCYKLKHNNKGVEKMTQKNALKKGTEYKTKYTQDELVKKLNAGEQVKAVDLMSSMGIKVIQF